MAASSDEHARRIFQRLQREEDIADTLQSSDPEVAAYNRGVDKRLQVLRDRAQFGENMEQVIQLNGTECPWSFGNEPHGTGDNPDGNDDMMRKYWRNVDRKGFEECNEKQTDAGLPDYNKAHKSATDSNPKYLKTRHPTQPYCVRCEMPKAVKTDYESTVKNLEKIANLMSTSHKTKKWEQRAELEGKLDRLKKEWNSVYNEIYFGKEVSDFAVPNMGCMDEASTMATWGDPNKIKTVADDDVEEYIDNAGNRKKRWSGRSYATRDPVSGKAYCGTSKDPNVQKDMAFHDLQALSHLKTDKSWPSDDNGAKMKMEDVYNEAAFCAQQTEDTCGDHIERDAPLGKKLRSSDKCSWASNYTTGGSCVPKNVRIETSGTNMGEIATGPDDRYSEWYTRFMTAEKQLVKTKLGHAQRTAGPAARK